MSTKNLTANGMIALAPTYELKSAHRDDAGNVYVFVKGLNTWRLVNESAHLFRPDATPPAADTYTPPATWHPNRCYCGRFGGGHIPGLRAPIRGDKSCEGDRVRPHDESTCGACLAGATDFRPVIETGQTWISNDYGTDHQVAGPGDELGTWAMWGPVGNLHVISEAGLYSRYTLDLDR